MVSTQALDKFYYYYYLIHIPVTVLMDSSLIIPPEYQLNLTKLLLNFHISTNKDFLLIQPIELWLKFFGLIELVFQLPFFVLNVVNLVPNKTKPIWNLVYALNVILTTTCCLVYIVATYESRGLATADAIKLFAIYLPYALVSLIMFIDSFKRISYTLERK